MFINAILVGVLGTILAELLIIFGIALLAYYRKRK